MKKDSNKKSKAGRKPKYAPAIHKHYFRLNDADNIRFETTFHLSGYKYKAHFIREKVLNTPITPVNIDKSMTDFIIRLSTFRGQFKNITNNYNQLLKLLKVQLGEKKALVFLYKLEQATIEFARIQREVELQIQKFEKVWLQK